ncbi:MAG: sigma-54-dependent Fis family transcriptional regulator [Planctomycetes bacterium]|nr:sigma-54-dependent Fis family transcriptional regulator [Planctomycetota bacterium]
MIYQINNGYCFVTGESPAMQKLIADAKRAAACNSNLLITGETGVGKEVTARFIHNESPRRNERFVVADCPALSSSLLETELFGHERGAFTGAESTRIGRFETAHKGTLLLDEISEIDMKLQAKLLGVLERKKLERVGSSASKDIDVRIIATTNLDLWESSRNKSFRQDLYFRLHVLHIEIPPLRERPDDIQPLVNYFLTKHCHENNLPMKSLSEKAMQLLMEYHWPGNIRELSNIIERTIVACPEKAIDTEYIMPALKTSVKTDLDTETLAGSRLVDVERKVITSTLNRFGGNKRKIAEILGISERTLRDKIRQYELINNERA